MGHKKGPQKYVMKNTESYYYGIWRIALDKKDRKVRNKFFFVKAYTGNHYLPIGKDY